MTAFETQKILRTFALIPSLARKSQWRPHGVVACDAALSGAGKFLEDLEPRGSQLAGDIERLAGPIAGEVKSLRILPVWEELCPVNDYHVRVHHILIDSHNRPYRLSREKT